MAANLNSSISTALMRPRRPKQYCLQLYIYFYISMKVSVQLPGNSANTVCLTSEKGKVYEGPFWSKLC